MDEGKCGWAFRYSDNHPCIILRVRDDGRYFVISGTSTARNDLGECLIVDPTTNKDIAEAFKSLTKVTMFYQRSTGTISPEGLSVTGRVNAEFVVQLRKLIGL